MDQGSLSQRIVTGTDWSPAQDIKVHGFTVLTPTGTPVDTTIKFYETNKTGNPVYEGVLDTSIDGLSHSENFTTPLRVQSAVVEVSGVGGIAYVRHS